MNDCPYCVDMRNSEYGIEEPHEAHEGNNMPHHNDCDITVRANTYSDWLTTGRPALTDQDQDALEFEPNCTCYVEEVDPCTCGCRSMIYSNFSLCSGCTDIITLTEDSAWIAGEEYCWACFAEYEYDRVQALMHIEGREDAWLDKGE